MIIFSALILATILEQCVCSYNNPDEVSIGFALNFDYGTATLSYPNGTLFEIAKVYSTADYQNTIRKLSNWSAAHFAPPYNTPQERWSDYGRQLKRRARKAVGMPASADVAALSTLISALKEESDKVLGFDIVSASASVPRIPALYDEDLYDSFEYAGLEYLQIVSSTYHHTLLTYEASAALAGHGLSVCANVTDPSTCPIDDLSGTYYVVDYTKSSLFAYHTQAASAYYIIDTVAFNFDLGSDALHDNPGESWYWDMVRKVLLQPLLEHLSTLPTKVILVGEKKSLDTPGFREMLNEVLTSVFKTYIPDILDSDPEWVQAKGVAELVRRRPYRPIPVKPEIGTMNDFTFEGLKIEQVLLGPARMDL